LKQYLLSVFILIAFATTALATHNRAGQITFTHITGTTYEIRVIIYTKPSSPPDRPTLPITFGDGTPIDVIPRVDQSLVQPDVQENVYVMQHTYPGSGTYNICVTDPNRNAGIINVQSSVDILFSISTVLRISPAFSPNTSPVFANRPIQDACFRQPWIHNPGAVDSEGDSLSYSLVTPLGNPSNECAALPENFYSLPNRHPIFPDPENQISIDPITGTVSWISPQQTGEYNLAILIEEWRDGISLGSILRDMQILVKVCDNLPPELNALPDTCIEAGQTLSMVIEASDPLGGLINITGYGGPFEVTSSPASITQLVDDSPVTAIFDWDANCSHVRLAPYQTNIQATDNGPVVNLVAIETFNITVVAPAPEFLGATATGSSIALTWEPSICDQAVGYKIYRRINLFGFIPDVCETGVPAYTGYLEIADIEGVDNNSFLDEDEVIFGRVNCYMVIAYFADGAESYASNEACAEIRFEIPIIKKNSVGITAEAGTDTIFWRNPIELDPDIFPGPYAYQLLRSDGYEAPTELVLETPEVNTLAELVTSFVSNPLNTADTAHSYRVVLFSGGEVAARSNVASSLFINLTPNDNQMGITWTENVPWINFRYDIYRQDEGVGEFEFVGTSDQVGYVDSGLVNNRNYCYYIVSHGSYFAIEEADTLINFSQQTCAQPFDRTPPCPPVIDLEGSCVDYTIDLNWTNPNLECPETDDVMLYNVYFSPTEGGEFEVIEVLDGDWNTAISFVFENSIAGCYAVTALDSLSLWPDGELRQNESDFSNIICIDNCPEYSLPNVITPNGDGLNDLLMAFPYRSIQSVEFTLFNRWGGIVFETTDPDIAWDGTNQDTGEIVSSSTYFYTCKVFTIRLSGIEPVNLSGYIQVFTDRNPTNN